MAAVSKSWAGSRLARAERGGQTALFFFRPLSHPRFTEWPQRAAKRSRSRGSAQGRPRTGSHRFCQDAGSSCSMRLDKRTCRGSISHRSTGRTPFGSQTPTRQGCSCRQGGRCCTPGHSYGQPVRPDATGTERWFPVTVATSVAVDTPVPRAAFSASAAGAIAYRTRGTSTSQLTWFDRSGRPLGTLGEPDGAELSNLDLSHDGSRVAAERTLQNDTDVWIVDSSKTTPFASGPGPQRFPIWSIDDTRVMLAIRGEFVQKSVGANREEPMAQFKGVLVPTDWSPDGRFVLCVDTNNKETGPDLTLVPTDRGKPIPFVNTRAAETWGQFSPDGHWVAFQSNESGKTRSSSVRFRTKADPGEVSILGGTQARWSRDAKGGVLHRPEWHVDDGAHCRPGRFC